MLTQATAPKALQQERGMHKELVEKFNKQAKKVSRLSQIIEEPHKYFCRLSSSDDKSSDPPERLQFIRATAEQFELYDESSKQLREDTKNTLDLLDSTKRSMAQLQNFLEELDTGCD
ncbi:hypothetical protein Tco_1043745 [Tanacetum coccineum]|uniref:Tubulin-specific chaperone A n=1 Tax=Tanacetum coccineum TaxID=301880 RepID=A0ABQ5GNK7_9ASTR